MKRFKLLLILLIMTSSITLARGASNELKIMVMSDLHLLAPELCGDGEVSRALARGEMKQVLLSDSIVGAMLRYVAERRPDVLLLTGDLTYNGETASHRQLLSRLQKLIDMGITVRVIPGNHDINNPHARSFAGDEASPTEPMDPGRFVGAYIGCGPIYNYDRHSISYSCDLAPNVMLIALDSNRYDENRLTARGDSVNTYHNGGRIKRGTLAWLRSRLQEACAKGKSVIVMVHHHLLEHFDGEARLLPRYIVENHAQVTDLLREYGVKTVLAGHLHITDAVTDEGITELATGSATTWPFPIREITVDTDKKQLATQVIFPDFLGDSTTEQGLLSLKNGAATMAGILASRAWSKMEPRLPQIRQMLAMQGGDTSRMPSSAAQLRDLVIKHLRQPLETTVVQVTRGNEDPAVAEQIIADTRAGLRAMLVEILPEMGEAIADLLLDEYFPEATVRSLLQDINRYGTPAQSATHDHTTTLPL